MFALLRRLGTAHLYNVATVNTIRFCHFLALLFILSGCDRDPSTKKTTTQPSSPVPAFLANLTPVGKMDPIESKAIVCLFTRTDCPVSNSYAPEVRRLHEKFSPRGVSFFLVYPDADESADAIARHLKEYSYPFPGLRDPRHELVKKSGAKITPEAAVFDPKGNLLYRGRIDDRFVDFGKERAAPTQHDLERALESILAGKPAPPPSGPAIGCFIADVK